MTGEPIKMATLLFAIFPSEETIIKRIATHVRSFKILVTESLNTEVLGRINTLGRITKLFGMEIKERVQPAHSNFKTIKM